MLLRKIINNPRTLLGVGQLSLCLGILLSRFLGGYWLGHFVSVDKWAGFIKGFLDAISVQLIIISILSNLRYLKLYGCRKKSFK